MCSDTLKEMNTRHTKKHRATNLTLSCQLPYPIISIVYFVKKTLATR